MPRLVALEIARRYRFAEDLARVPEGVTVHVMPSGGAPPGSGKLNATIPTLRGSEQRMQQAYRRSVDYLRTPSIRAASLNPEGDLSIESRYGITVHGRDSA